MRRRMSLHHRQRRRTCLRANQPSHQFCPPLERKRCKKLVLFFKRHHVVLDVFGIRCWSRLHCPPLQFSCGSPHSLPSLSEENLCSITEYGYPNRNGRNVINIIRATPSSLSLASELARFMQTSETNMFYLITVYSGLQRALNTKQMFPKQYRNLSKRYFKQLCDLPDCKLL